MATITERTAKDGSTRYTAQVRLKGYPTQTATFRRLTDAKKWVVLVEAEIIKARGLQAIWKSPL